MVTYVDHDSFDTIVIRASEAPQYKSVGSSNQCSGRAYFVWLFGLLWAMGERFSIIFWTYGGKQQIWAQQTARCLHTTHCTSPICAVSTFPVSYVWQPNAIYSRTHLLYKHCCCAIGHDFIHKIHTVWYSARPYCTMGTASAS